MTDQTSRIVAELDRSECGELRLSRGSPLACGVMCFVSSIVEDCGTNEKKKLVTSSKHSLKLVV